MNEREYKNLVNEGADGYLPPNANEERCIVEARAMTAAWTVEVTTARRTRWNAEMTEAKNAGHKVIVHEAEQKLGFALADLKAAILRHKL